MKRIFVLLVAALAITGAAVADDSIDVYLTGTLLNGRAWKEMDISAKTHYLLAYNDGMRMAFIAAAALTNKKLEDMQAAMDILEPTNLTYGEKRQALDKFYNDPLNGPVPITSALSVIALQAKGATPAEISKAIRDARADSHPQKDQ